LPPHRLQRIMHFEGTSVCKEDTRTQLREV